MVIGVGALAAVAYFGMNFPADSGDAAGTVTPAERYRAEQPGVNQIQLGIRKFRHSCKLTLLPIW